MAGNAGKSLSARMLVNGSRHRDMAVATSRFCNSFVHRIDLNGFVKVLKRKGPGVIEAIYRFDCIFPHKVVRRMAVVTGGYIVMTRLKPSRKLLVHDVAIGTRAWIIGEIGPTAGVRERIATKPEQSSKDDGK